MTKSLKVLFLGELPPDTQNGVAQMNISFISILKAHHDVSICEDKPQKKFLSRLIGFILAFVRVSFFKRYDVIYMNLPTSSRGAFKLILILFFWPGTYSRVIFHLHRGDIDQTKTLAHNILFRYLGRRCRIIVLGEKFKSMLVDLYPELDIQVVQNFSQISSRPIKSTFTGKQRVIIYFSNVLKSKGIEEFVLLARNWSNFSDDLVFRIYGQEIDSGCLDNLPNNCFYMGAIKDNLSKENMFDDAYALVFLSKNEGCPLVILESMQFGVPVICYDTGMINEMVGDGYHFLVNNYSFESVQEKLADLVLLDSDAYDEICSYLFLRVNRKFSYEESRESFLKVFCIDGVK